MLNCPSVNGTSCLGGVRLVSGRRIWGVVRYVLSRYVRLNLLISDLYLLDLATEDLIETSIDAIYRLLTDGR